MSRSYEYDANVLLVILAVAALAILACVVLVSLGRGGELTEFPPDVPPLDLPEPGQLTAVDFMALQLPVNLVGYHTQSVDETLRRAASAISARDTRIAVLEQRVSELLASRLQARQEVYAAPGAGLRTEHEPPAVPRELAEQGDPPSAANPVPASFGQNEPGHHEPGHHAFRPDESRHDEAGRDDDATGGHEQPPPSTDVLVHKGEDEPDDPLVYEASVDELTDKDETPPHEADDQAREKDGVERS